MGYHGCQGAFPLRADTFTSVKLLAFDPLEGEKNINNKSFTLPPPRFQLLLLSHLGEMPGVAPTQPIHAV